MRMTASAHRHVILAIRSPVCPKKVLPLTRHAHVILRQLKHQRICMAAELVIWPRLKC